MILYDTATRALSIDPAQAKPWGADVAAVLDRHGQTIDLTGVSFGVTVTVNGQQTNSHAWPAPGVVYRSTDQDVLTSVRVRWQADDSITVAAWLESPLGRVEASETFTAPRPPQPYPSWTWQNGAWTPPTPYPDDGGEYQWNEDAQAWEPVA